MAQRRQAWNEVCFEWIEKTNWNVIELKRDLTANEIEAGLICRVIEQANANEATLVLEIIN